MYGTIGLVIASSIKGDSDRDLGMLSPGKEATCSKESEVNGIAVFVSLFEDLKNVKKSIIARLNSPSTVFRQRCATFGSTAGRPRIVADRERSPFLEKQRPILLKKACHLLTKKGAETIKTMKMSIPAKTRLENSTIEKISAGWSEGILPISSENRLLKIF